MKIGLNVDENLKTLFDEISSLEYLDIEVDECKLDDIDIIIIDTRKEKLNEYLTKYKQKGILIIALVGEEDIYKMRELFLCFPLKSHSCPSVPKPVKARRQKYYNSFLPHICSPKRKNGPAMPTKVKRISLKKKWQELPYGKTSTCSVPNKF